MQALTTRWRLLAAIGLAAYVVFALVTLPARIALAWFAPENVHAAGASGTIWNGRAEAVAVNGTRVGAVQWRLHPLALLTAHLSADVNVRRVDGFMQARLSTAPGGRLRLEELTGSLPLSALPQQVAPGGWAGALNLRLARLVLENGWPVDAEGMIEAANVAGPVHKPVELGSYRVTFAADAHTNDVLRGALADAGGPLQVAGDLQLKAADRSYLIEGVLLARPDAPRDIANMVQFLGPPDAQGRRQFSLAGTL